MACWELAKHLNVPSPYRLSDTKLALVGRLTEVTGVRHSQFPFRDPNSIPAYKTEVPVVFAIWNFLAILNKSIHS